MKTRVTYRKIWVFSKKGVPRKVRRFACINTSTMPLVFISNHTFSTHFSWPTFMDLHLGLRAPSDYSRFICRANIVPVSLIVAPLDVFLIAEVTLIYKSQKLLKHRQCTIVLHAFFFQKKVVYKYC